MAEERFTSSLKENWLEPINHRKVQKKLPKEKYMYIYIYKQKKMLNEFLLYNWERKSSDEILPRKLKT